MYFNIEQDEKNHHSENGNQEKGNIDHQDIQKIMIHKSEKRNRKNDTNFLEYMDSNILVFDYEEETCRKEERQHLLKLNRKIFHDFQYHHIENPDRIIKTNFERKG